jgi:hypothetical protein
MDVKPVDDNATREPMGPSPPLTLPIRPPRQSGQLPTGEVSTVCAQVKTTIAALVQLSERATQVSERCRRAGHDIERLAAELQDMIGKL